MGVEALIKTSVRFFDHKKYRVIATGIAAKRPWVGVVFSVIGFVSRFRIGSVILLVGAAAIYRSIRRPPDMILFQFGLSQNNERSFRRINDIISRPEWNSAINGLPVPLSMRLAAVRDVRLLWHLACEFSRAKVESSLARTQVVLTLAAWLIYRKSDFGKVQCVCVASDHSPSTLALLHVARERRLRTCYVQHAPVASHFPTLNYDLSLLFDRASLAVYAKAAADRGVENKGDIAILPPFEECAVMPDLPDHPPYRLGICLSYLFDLDGVGKLLARLLDHASVASISLRRHPRCKADLTDLQRDRKVAESRADSLAEFAQECDIALVPNSGVAIELLHLGKPVMYIPGVDSIAYDYYGFVRAGIVPVFHQEWLASSSHLRGFFGRAWRERYLCFDETVQELPEVSRERAGNAFWDLLEECRTENMREHR